MSILYMYETMKKMKEDLDSEMEVLKMRTCENYVSLIQIKKKMYNGMILGFCNVDKALRQASARLNDIKNGNYRADNNNGDNYLACLISGIEGCTGIKVSEIKSILFDFNDMKYTIDFVDKEYGNTLRLRIPNIKSEKYDVSATDIETGFGYEKFTASCFCALKALETSLVLIEEKDDLISAAYFVTSFPDKVETIEKFKDEYDKFIQRKDNIVLL